ncbi:MAG: hypothetical protein ABEI58_02340 [Candidatus Nanohaloarchaea archaeon]
MYPEEPDTTYSEPARSTGIGDWLQVFGFEAADVFEEDAFTPAGDRSREGYDAYI